MCAQFALKIRANDLSIKYGIKVPETLETIDDRFLPYKLALVIVKSKEDLKLVRMNFSLVPSWSKDSRVKFATHNARIETIVEKPTWKIPFKNNHCVVPLTSFYESVYQGALAGHIVEFSENSDELLFAAGIYDKWIDKSSNTILYSFSILTTTPSDFIEKNGHDRSPIFLSYEDSKKWLVMQSNENEMIDFLKTSNQILNLKVKKDRPLKAGWEKRK